AMLARRPVIAANAGAIPEILDNGRVGLMFPPGDGAALAACLRQVQSGATDALLDPAEQRARTAYSAERMRLGIEAVVAEVVPARR
ncbi:MAG: glycosyltransferase family 1 protein, partial [Pseudomonadota bacterium]|nr:glycosyltransferase family 1 protein [Pseudomonadota bacterium]